MQALLEVLPIAANEPERFKTAIEKVLDVQTTLRYMAYLEIVGSIHADETHNQRYFFDLRTQKLKPIVWDPVAYYREKIDGIDFAPNGLFQALLQIPEYREEKNRCVWEAIHGALSPGRVAQLIEDSADSVRKEILASPQKVYTFGANLDMMPNSEWESSVHELVEKSRARSEVLRSALRKISISAQSKGFHRHAHQNTPTCRFMERSSSRGGRNRERVFAGFACAKSEIFLRKKSLGRVVVSA
jgi:hypothetical protein